MRSLSRILLPAVLGAAFTAFGCSSGPALTQSPTAAQATAPQQVQSADRSVLDLATPPSMDQLAKVLPQRIPASEAGKLLVHIPANSIVQDKSYSVQAWGGRGYHGYGGHFGYHGYGGFRGYRSYGGYYPYYSYGLYPYLYGAYGLYNLSYYPYGGYYYPYSLYGGYYYPMSYYYNSAYYYPYLYRARSLYYPYYWSAWL